MASKQINPNGLAIVETLTAHEGETLAFAEIAQLANIPAQTGFLTAAKKIAKERGYSIEKVEDAIEVQEDIVAHYPHGEFKRTRSAKVAGYRLVKAK